MFDKLLADIRVIDLTQNVAGPFCTQILGDLGADIIKIERPRSGDDTRAWPPAVGTGSSATFAAYNRNKRSVCVDLRGQEGSEIISRLAKNADVFIHSMKPGSAEKLSLGFDHLKSINPRLIYCAISAFGENGPLAQEPGYDPLVQAFVGIMSTTGNEGEAPVRVGVPVIDMGTGMWAALAIFAALMNRQQTGSGVQVNVSLLETGMSWMSLFAASYLASGKLPRKLGSAIAMSAPNQLFPSSDGHVFIAAPNDRLFAAVCKALDCIALLGDARFSTNTDRVLNQRELIALLSERTRSRSTSEIVAALREAGAPCSEMNDLSGILQSEQVAALDLLAPLPATEGAALKVVRLPMRANGERMGRLMPPPTLGADTGSVLSELGYDDDEIEAMKLRGSVA